MITLRKRITTLVKKQYWLAFTLFIMLCSVHAQDINWKIDPSHSKIGFGISYFKIGEIKGVFDKYQGSFVSNNNDLSSVSLSIETASINTNQKNRDKHLKTDDFFAADKHPEIKFVSTSIKKIADKEYELRGDFTMTGITKPITLKLIFKGEFLHPRFKKQIRIYQIEGIIPREDFKVGTNYPAAKLALSNDVALLSEIHITKEN